MSRARDLSKLVNPSLFSVSTDNNVGVNSTAPVEKLNVVGVVSATAFYGDGSNLEGVASAGLGTAVDDDSLYGGQQIYYTNKELRINGNLTVDVPDSAEVAYTQYQEIVVDSGADFIVGDGDDFIPDILGISSDVQQPGLLAGGGGRVRADNFSDKSGTGAPTFSSGVVVTGVATATSFSGNLTGNVTGNVTGNADTATNAQGLTGTPDITVGDITANNISIGGTLTYEDVTNVDSIGILTARSGIKVGAGQSISPISGTITYYGDGSQLTGVTAGGEANFVASGTIPGGATVIINTDGTVSAATTTGVGTFISDPVVLNTTSLENCVAVYDSGQDRVVVFYHDRESISQTAAVVGTISGNTISFGSPAQANNSYTSYHDACYHTASGKIVYVYRDDGDNDYAKCRIGTVSGTSISFGSETNMDTGGPCGWPKVCYDANAERFVAVWSQGTGQGSGSYAGKAVVGNVSGTTPTFGTIATFESGRAYGKDIVYDASQQQVVVYFVDNTDSNAGSAIVGTVAANGLDISFFQNDVQFEADAVTSSSINAVYDSVNQKTICVYNDSSNNGMAVVGTISGSGTSRQISFGTPQIFNSGSTNHIGAEYDPDAQKVIIVYQNSKFKEVEVTGTTLTFGPEQSFATFTAEYPGMAYDTEENKMVIAVKNGNASGVGTAVMVSGQQISTNLTTENYIGIAAEAIADGQTGKVNIIGGINSGQTGLTTAQTYYVQNDGSLGLVAGNPSVVAGTSISSTEILVR